MPNHMREEPIVSRPKIDQEIPVDLREVLQIHERILIITREGEATLQRRANKALWVVGARVKQMAKNLLLCPLPFARTRRCVSVIQFQQQRFGLGHSSAKVRGDRGKISSQGILGLGIFSKF